VNPDIGQPAEVEQDWFFTFGANHVYPGTDESLGRNYVRVYGTCDSTREEMLAAFGNRWSQQYSPAEKPLTIDRFDLVEVQMPGADFEQDVARHAARLDAERPAGQPVTPAEERTGVSDVRWAVREQVVILRAYLDDVSDRFLQEESSVIFEALDRIEQWTRGQS